MFVVFVSSRVLSSKQGIFSAWGLVFVLVFVVFVLVFVVFVIVFDNLCCELSGSV